MIRPVAIAIAVVAAGSLALSACGGSAKQSRKVEQQAENLRLDLARTYIDKGAGEAAVPLLRRAIAERPNNLDARVMYGEVLRDLGLYPQAEQQLLYALNVEQRFAPAHAALGILYDLQRQHDKARRHHVTAVKLAPGAAQYYNNLGFSLYLAGDTDGAIAALEHALALDPSLGVAYNNLGFAYGRRGDFAAAERTFTTAGGKPAALMNLALVYDEHGRSDDAAELREQAYQLVPDLRPDPERTTP